MAKQTNINTSNAKGALSLPVVIVFIAFVLPLVVGFLKTSDVPNLTGIVINNEKPKLTAEDWFTSAYQNSRDDYNNDHWAFKESFVRLNNQLYYNLFNQIRVNGFVAAKNNYVMSEGYIFAHYGDDYKGKAFYEDLIAKAKVVQDTLAKKGISLILSVAPGKGQMCEEFIEDKYKHKVTRTNYQEFMDVANQHKIPILDLYSYFGKLKTNTPYPLFTPFSHHWTNYGACLAADTILKYIEFTKKMDLPNIFWKDIQLSDTTRGRDADILKSMNLYTTPKLNMQLAYPVIQSENDSLRNNCKGIVISDSYWYDQPFLTIQKYGLNDAQFWYYYNKIVPNPGNGIRVWELNLKEEIEKSKVILLMYSDGNLANYGNQFINDAYELYTSPNTYWQRNNNMKNINTFEKYIKDTPTELKKVTRISADKQIPLDTVIRTYAKELIQKQLEKK